MPNALLDPYANITDYHAAVIKSDASHDLDIDADLNAVSRYIDSKVGRFFGQVTVPEARTYEGSGIRRLWTDDIVSLTKVAIDENLNGQFDTVLAPTDYQLIPLNAPMGPESNPYTGLQLVWWGSRFIFPPISQVRVTGIFGWPAVPVPVKRGCIQLTAILRLETPRARREMMAADMILQTSPQAQFIIQDLIDQYARAGALVL